jgi:hypothetical protein
MTHGPTCRLLFLRKFQNVNSDIESRATDKIIGVFGRIIYLCQIIHLSTLHYYDSVGEGVIAFPSDLSSVVPRQLLLHLPHHHDHFLQLK